MKYKLTEKGKEKIGEFLKECQRKREFLLNTGMDTAHYTSVIILKDTEDFESIPFGNEDPECKRIANVLFNMSLGMDFDISTAKSLFNTYKKELNLLEEQIQALKESNLLLLYCVLMDIVENNYSGMENSKVDYDGNIVE